MLKVATGALLVSSMLVAACSSGPRTPDEFRVVRKAPLTVPPEYNLRPPGTGEAIPQELSPDAERRMSVFGRDLGANASPGERALVDAAGASATERTIRAAVDFESSQSLKKNEAFADSVLNYGSEEGATAEQAAAEQAAAEEVTGGGDVMIRRRAASKLPGL